MSETGQPIFLDRDTFGLIERFRESKSNVTVAVPPFVMYSGEQYIDLPVESNFCVLPDERISIVLQNYWYLTRSLYQESKIVAETPSSALYEVYGSEGIDTGIAIESGVEITYAFVRFLRTMAGASSDPIELEVTKKFMNFERVEAIYGYRHRKEDRFMVIFRSDKNDELLLLELIEQEFSIRNSYPTRMITIEFLPTNLPRKDLVNPAAKQLFERVNE